MASIKIKFFMLLLVLTCILAGCSSGKNTPDENENKEERLKKEEYTISYSDSYSSKGRCYIDNCILHFYDAATGKDVILCSKPNCQHKRTDAKNVSTCDAYLGSNSQMPVMTSDELLFISAPSEWDDGGEGWLFDKALYRADLDGRNRREVVRLNGVQNITEMDYEDGLAALCFIASVDEDKKEYDEIHGGYSYGEREKRKSGIWLINVKLRESTLVAEYDEYSAMCGGCVLDDGKLTYYIYYSTENVQYSDYENPDDYYAKTAQTGKMEIYTYDINTRETQKMFDGTRNFTDSIGSGYVAIDETVEVTSRMRPIMLVKAGEVKAHYTVQEMKPEDYDPEYVVKYVYEEKLYMMDGRKFWCKDLNTGSLYYPADGRLNDKGINRIQDISGDYIYFSTSQQGNNGKVVYSYYVTETEEFFAGNLENAKLMYSYESVSVTPDNNADPDSDGDKNSDNGIGSAAEDIRKHGDDETDADLFEKASEYFKYSGPEDENTLTWAIWDIHDTAEQICERVNSRLKEAGYDFTMSIYELAADASPYLRNYGKLMLECGADIIFTGMGNADDERIWSPAYEGIKNNRFLKLDDYLKGSRLYEQYPEKLWDSVRVDGSIYCIPNPNNMSRCFAVVFKKSAYSEEEINSFDDTIEGLAKLISKENKLFCGGDDFLSMYGIWQDGDLGICYTDGKIRNQLDYELYTEGLRTLNGLAEEGMLISSKKNLMLDTKDEWSIALCSDYHAARLDENEYYVKTYPVPVEPHFTCSIAISADCKNPEAAFKLIELIVTEPEFANAVLYDDNIILKDGFAYDPENDKYVYAYWGRMQWGIKETAYKSKEDAYGYYDTPQQRKDYYENKLGPVEMASLEYPIEIRQLRNLADEHDDIVFNVRSFEKELETWKKDAEEIFKNIK